MNKKTLLWMIPVVGLVIIGIVVIAIYGLTLIAKSQAEINYLTNRVTNLERITSPPKVSVLSEEIGISLGKADDSFTLSVSKLLIEELGTDTMVRAEIFNKSDKAKTYLISNRKATRTTEGYKELDINSPYVVVPLTNTLKIDAGEKKPIVVMVSSLECDNYEDTEAWISVMENSSEQLQSEVVLRILIKAN
jgi:hypothetical protein